MNYLKLLQVCLVGLVIFSCKPAPILAADYARWFSLEGLSESNITGVVDERGSHGVARFSFLVSPEEYAALVKSAYLWGQFPQ